MLVLYQAAWSVFPDVPPCLAALSSHTLGIISNGSGMEQRDKLHRAGIADRFGVIVISEECGYVKPDPAIFHFACQTAGFQPQHAVYVGDLYEADALGARSGGLAGVWLNRQSATLHDQAPPIIHELNEFSAWAHARAL